MYPIVKDLAKPSILAKPVKTCISCSGSFSLSSKFLECSECRRNSWRQAELLKGRSSEELRLLDYMDISFLEREALLRSQDGRCAICRIPEEESKRPLVIDHCHKSGKIRALLCNSCNVGLGMFKDDPEFLRAAAEYLE